MCCFIDIFLCHAQSTHRNDFLVLFDPCTTYHIITMFVLFSSISPSYAMHHPSIQIMFTFVCSFIHLFLCHAQSTHQNDFSCVVSPMPNISHPNHVCSIFHPFLLPMPGTTHPSKSCPYSCVFSSMRHVSHQNHVHSVFHPFILTMRWGLKDIEPCSCVFPSVRILSHLMFLSIFLPYLFPLLFHLDVDHFSLLLCTI